MKIKKLKWIYNKTRKEWRCNHDGMIVIIFRMVNPKEFRLGWYIAREFKPEAYNYADYEWAYNKLSSAKQAAWLRFFG
jgi:hypothetical protein